jgi:hypothetical protein
MKHIRYPGAALPAAQPDYARSGLNLRSRAQVASIIAISVGVGLLLSILWSFEVADGVLGATIANTALGSDARNVEIGGPTSGIVFAFVAGLAATFTACNCVVFSCIAPLAGQPQAARRSMLPTLGWMTLGVLTVTIAYGIAGAIFGRALPMLSSATLPIGGGQGYPVRLAQSTLVFVTLGVILVGWGLADLRRGADAAGAPTAARAWIKPLCLGLIIGGFTVGRPFPLFRKAFEYAAETGNPLFSAAAMALQGLGNIALIVVLLLALTYATGGRAPRWLARHPQATVVLTAASLIVGGVFLIAYWGLRVPSIFGIGWFPRMPYN